MNLRPGTTGKIGLGWEGPSLLGKEGGAERFWVEIKSVGWPNFIGSVDNVPVGTESHGFTPGDPIIFHACHILDIYADE